MVPRAIKDNDGSCIIASGYSHLVTIIKAFVSAVMCLWAELLRLIRRLLTISNFMCSSNVKNVLLGGFPYYLLCCKV